MIFTLSMIAQETVPGCLILMVFLFVKSEFLRVAVPVN